MTTGMSKQRLSEILDAYGADPKRWPEPERAAAHELLARAPELEAKRVQAAKLDAALDAAGAVGDLRLEAASMAARITRNAANVRLLTRRPRFMDAWPGLAGLAAAAAAGLFIGWIGVGDEFLGNGAAAETVAQVNGFVPTEEELW